MAIDKKLWDKAKLLFEHGESLNEISKQTGIYKGTISKKATKEGWEKSEKSTLVEEEIHTLLMQDEINQKKSTLSNLELQHHNQKVIEGISREIAQKVFDRSTMKNQDLLDMAQEGIIESVTNEDGTIDKQFLTTQLPNILAISKGTESNRKQLLGATETYTPKPEGEGKQVKTWQVTYKKSNV